MHLRHTLDNSQVLHNNSIFVTSHKGCQMLQISPSYHMPASPCSFHACA